MPCRTLFCLLLFTYQDAIIECTMSEALILLLFCFGTEIVYESWWYCMSWVKLWSHSWCWYARGVTIQLAHVSVYLTSLVTVSLCILVFQIFWLYFAYLLKNIYILQSDIFWCVVINKCLQCFPRNQVLLVAEGSGGENLQTWPACKFSSRSTIL